MNTYVLPNGLSIYCYQDTSKHSVSVNLIVKYGGVDSQFKVNGVPHQIVDGMAHLIEHYVLEQGAYGDLMKYFGEHYMKSNGMTSSDHTLFFFDAVTNVDKGLEKLIKGIHKVEFTHEKLENTKFAIRDEIRMRKDQKSRRIAEEGMKNIFHNIPYRNNLGSIEQLDSITVKDIKLCFESFYQPNNEFIVIAGNFDEQKMVKDIEKLYNSLNFSENIVEKIIIEEPSEIVNSKGFVSLPTGEPMYNLTFKIDLNHFITEEKLRLDFYFSYFLKMNFGSLSPLRKKIIEKEIIKDRLFFNRQNLSHFMIFTISAYTERFEELKRNILESIQYPTFDPDIFELSLKDTKLDFVLRPESLTDIVFPFVNNIVEYNYPYMDDIDYLKQFNFVDFCTMISNLNFDFYTETILMDQN